MGWSSGSELFDTLVGSLLRHVPDDDVREQIYNDMIEAFESYDCDTLYECVGQDPILDDIITDRYLSEEDA